jgi:hypothetical protein
MKTKARYSETDIHGTSPVVLMDQAFVILRFS